MHACVCVISLLGFWLCRNTFPYVCVDGSCHNKVEKKGRVNMKPSEAVPRFWITRLERYERWWWKWRDLDDDSKRGSGNDKEDYPLLLK